MFNCSVEGGDARVRWLHDGVPVGGGERVLRVHGVVRAHRGMYQCFAERDLDSAQAAAELRLGGKKSEIIRDHNYTKNWPKTEKPNTE